MSSSSEDSRDDFEPVVGGDVELDQIASHHGSSSSGDEGPSGSRADTLSSSIKDKPVTSCCGGIWDRPIKLCVRCPGLMCLAFMVLPVILCAIIPAGQFKLENGVLLEDRDDRAYKDLTAFEVARETFANLSKEANKAGSDGIPPLAARERRSSFFAFFQQGSAFSYDLAGVDTLFGGGSGNKDGQVYWQDSEASSSDNSWHLRAEQSAADHGGLRTKSVEQLVVQFRTDAKKGDEENILTKEYIELIRAVEDDLLALGGFKKRCQQLQSGQCLNVGQRQSITRYFYPDSNGTFNGAGSQIVSDVPAQVGLMAAGIGQAGAFAEVGFFVKDGFDSDDPESSITRFLLNFGVDPGVKQDEHQREIEDYQVDELVPWFEDRAKELKGKGLLMYYYSDAIKRAEENGYLITDLSLTGVSLAVVFVLIWVQTLSLCITITGVLMILLSVPMAIGLYSTILQFPYWGTLHVLSIYIILGIGADDLFVFFDTWAESGREHNPDDKQARMIWTWARASLAMAATSTTTIFAFIATSFTPLVGVRTFGIFTACMVGMNYYMVITVFPCAVLIWDKYVAAKPPCRVRSDADVKPSLVLRFFTKYYTPFILRKAVRLATLVVLSLIVLVFCVVAGALTVPDDQDLELYPVGTNVRDSRDLFDEFAERGNEGVQIVVAIGIEGIDQSGTDPYEGRNDKGEVVWDEKMNLWPYPGDPISSLINICRDFPGNEDLQIQIEPGWTTANATPPYEVSCFPYGVDAAIKRSGQTFTSEQQFKQLYPQVNTQIGYQNEWNSIDSRLYFAYIVFNTSLPESASFLTGEPVRDAWYEAVDEFNEDAAHSTVQTLVTTFDNYWAYFNIQGLLYSSFVSGVFISLAFSWVVLTAFTQNPIVSTIAIVVIGGCVATLLTIFVIAGWKISVVESIAAIMVVGFSVDFTVHVVHSYLECTEDTREARTAFALNTVGVSVLSGALTTLGSAFVLFFTTVVFMTRYGTVIFCIILFSLFYSMTWLPSMLATFGPQGNTGDLKALFKKCRK